MTDVTDRSEFHYFRVQLEKQHWPKVFDLSWGIRSIPVFTEERSFLEGVYTVRRYEK